MLRKLNSLLTLTTLLQKLNVEPISGVSSDGYKGKGFIQSKPSGKSEEELTGAADEE